MQQNTIQEMDLYDFDNTVLPIDSGFRFWLFCLLRYPWILLCVPVQLLAGAVLFWSMTRLKKFFFCFAAIIPLEKAVHRFWEKYAPTFYPWAKKEQRERFTVVISASPDFLLQEAAQLLELDVLICTRHSRKTGAIIGKNCRDEEKVRRFRELYPEGSVKVHTVYSDSIRHDRPLFSLGEHCVYVKNGQRIPFDYAQQYK